MSEVLTYDLNDFNLRSSWVCKGGRITTAPSTAKATKTVEVSGIPDGATIESVVLKATTGSPLTGASELTVNEQQLYTRTPNEVDFTSTVTGNGSWDFLFIFRAHGNGAMSDGSHYASCGFSAVSLVITYTGEAPDDDPVDDTYYDYPDSHNICFYAPDEEDFTTNGFGILSPISCEVKEEAGGEYECEMQLAAEGDLWKLIECESIIKVPVPVVTIDSFEMAGAAYWKVKSNYSSVQVKSRIPSIVRVSTSPDYDTWSGVTRYTTNDKVSYNGSVYQYIGKNDAFTMAPQEATKKHTGIWVNVSSYALVPNYGKTLATMTRNEVFTKVSDERGGWIRVKTNGGVTGYVESKYVEFYSNADSKVERREIRQQCFRVYRIEKDSHSKTVTINARHISYDFAKVYLGPCAVTGVTVPSALSLVQEAELMADNRQLYTDIAEDTVDLDCSWDNAVTALLNPDTGIVAQLQAKLIRDNEDFFVLADDHTDRGYRITYGNNLKALKWTTDTSSMVTRIIPHAKTKEDDDLLLPEQWVDSDLIDEYPVVYTESMAVNCKIGDKGVLPDGTEVEKLTQDQCYEIMRDEAQKRFTVDHADEPEITVDVDMLMLGSTVEYQHLAPTEILFMYDTVHIRHPQLGLDITAYMTGYTYDAILRRYKTITLTNERRRKDTSIAGFDLPDNSIRFEKLSSTAVDRLKS